MMIAAATIPTIIKNDNESRRWHVYEIHFVLILKEYSFRALGAPFVFRLSYLHREWTQSPRAAFLRRTGYKA